MKKATVLALVLTIVAATSAYAAPNLVEVFNVVGPTGFGVCIQDQMSADGSTRLFRLILVYSDLDGSGDLSRGDLIISRRWVK